MSKRPANPVAEGATAKRRPVRNLCAYAPRELNFQLPVEHSRDIFRARDEKTGVEKEKPQFLEIGSSILLSTEL